MLELDEQHILEREQFTLICDFECKESSVELGDFLAQRMEEIMRFFSIEKLTSNPVIYMSSKRAVFRKHVEEIAQMHEGVCYQDWMIADTYDGDINLLSLDACRETQAHRGLRKEEYLKIIVHEFVHICQRECFNRTIEREKFCGWFWEALATNLSRQEYPDVEVDCTAEQLLLEFPNISNSYTYAYLIGKYMLAHFAHEKIMDYVYYPEKLAEETAGILEQMKGN